MRRKKRNRETKEAGRREHGDVRRGTSMDLVQVGLSKRR